MLQDEVLRAKARLRKPDQPMLLGVAGRQVRAHPGLQLGGHEGLVLQARIARVVRVPRGDAECRFDNGEVVLILGIKYSECVESVSVRGVKAGCDRKDIDEVVGDAGRWVR